MNKQTIILLYSMKGLSCMIIHTTYNAWFVAILDDYPLYRSAFVYGLTADYTSWVGGSHSCYGMTDCAKVSCKIFEVNHTVAHIVVDPINDGRLPKPNCNFEDASDWYQRMQDGDEILRQVFYVLLAASIVTCLRLLIGVTNLYNTRKSVEVAAKLLFFIEKLVLALMLVLQTKLTQLQFPYLAATLLIMDVVVHCSKEQDLHYVTLQEKV